MTYRSRRRLSLLILLVGMPAYVVAVVTLINWLDRSYGRMPVALEMVVYIVLGVVWILPFKAVFTGIGQADPDAAPPPDDR